MNGAMYNDFHIAMIHLLNAGQSCDGLFHSGEIETKPLDAGLSKYSFAVCWRLVGSLPPPVSYLTSLSDYKTICQDTVSH